MILLQLFIAVLSSVGYMIFKDHNIVLYVGYILSTLVNVCLYGLYIFFIKGLIERDQEDSDVLVSMMLIDENVCKLNALHLSTIFLAIAWLFFQEFQIIGWLAITANLVVPYEKFSYLGATYLDKLNELEDTDDE